MSKQGRPPNNEPATAYDYRRMKTIIDILAMDKSQGLKLTDLRTIAHGWKVGDDGDFNTLLQRLAQHALEHARSQERQP